MTGTDVNGPDDVSRAASVGRRPWQLAVAVAIGLVEGAILVLYGLSIVVFEVVGTTSGVAGNTDVAPLALVAILVILGAIVVAVSLATWKGSQAARTPFVLIQAFAVVAAWTLATADIGWERTLGVSLIVAAVIAALLVISTPWAGTSPE